MNLYNSGKYNVFYTQLAAALCIAILLGGCRSGDEPRMRFGAFFGSPGGMTFPEPNNLGIHGFDSGMNEHNGMVYTCKGGFIDLGHVREAADRTVYLRNIAYQNLISKKMDYSFHVIDPSRYWVKVDYPLNWDNRPAQEKDAMTNEVSILLGQYFAHTSMVWHEIMTGYGFSTAGLFPDTISSFSPEDPYSDLLGTCLAAQALREEPLNYNNTMTKLLYQTLKELDVQPAKVTRQAAKSIEGKWYTGGFYFFVTMNKRNFDVGLDNCYITPSLVPGISSNTVGRPYLVPCLEEIERYGFKVHVEIESLVFENNRMYNAIGLNRQNRIEPQIHFRPLIEQLKNRLANTKIVTQKTRTQNDRQFGKL